jgi:salicylate 5-hydroxylase small subunit
MTSNSEDIVSVIALHAEYAACIDEERFADWPGFFTEDCSYRVVAR